MYWVLRYHIWIWMLEVLAIANSFSIWNINDNGSEMSKVNISIIFPHVLEQGGNSLISGFHIQSIYWNDRFNCYFAQTKFARNVYLLKVSNQSINTDVQEVVQEGLDKCFSSLSDYLGLLLHWIVCISWLMWGTKQTSIWPGAQSITFNIVEKKTICKNVLCNLFWQFCKFLFQSDYFKTSDSEYNAKLIVKRNLQNKMIQPIALGVKHFIWLENFWPDSSLCTGVNNIFNHQGHH